jgi:hypothetical protein
MPAAAIEVSVSARTPDTGNRPSTKSQNNTCRMIAPKLQTVNHINSPVGCLQDGIRLRLEIKGPDMKRPGKSFRAVVITC